MKTFIKTNITLRLVATVAAAAFLAGAAPCRAEKPTQGQTCPVTKDDGDMHCTVNSIEVTSDGILHCRYDRVSQSPGCSVVIN